MRRTGSFACAFVGLAAVVTASPPSIGGDISPDLAMRRHEARHSRGAEPASYAVLVRLKRLFTAQERAELLPLGVQLGRARALGHTSACTAIVPSMALDHFAEQPAVAAVEPAWPRWTAPAAPEPDAFNQIPLALGIPSVWQRRDPTGRKLRGDGQVFVDFDGGLDPYHPMFFRADAGVFPWGDANADGSFDPGVDTVHLDAGDSTVASPHLRVLGGGVFALTTGVWAPPGPYAADLGWLYADLDDDGVRDEGPAAGFDEEDPAWGEPLFVVDDVNGNRALDVGEKLVRLGTSKLRGIARPAEGKTWERGKGLHLAPRLGMDAVHGTGVAGLLLGGQPGHGRVQGVAPDAELVFIDLTELSNGPWLSPDGWLSTGLELGEWALSLGGQVFVHEYGSQIGQFADGSSVWEQALTEWAASGIPQLTATHNYAGLGGHGVFPVPPGENATAPFDVDWATVDLPTSSLFLTLRWRGGSLDDLELALVVPTGAVVPLEGGQSTDGLAIITTSGTSSRGTHMVFAWIHGIGGGGAANPVSNGAYAVLAAHSGALPVELHGALADDTGYAMVLSWTEGETDAGTVAYPATADGVIRVGASSGNVPDPGKPLGSLRYFSGQGPRIDGDRGVDLVAPDDHRSAFPAISNAGNGHYVTFGGTSGALPLVAGALALLRQAEPDLTARELPSRLAALSHADPETGVLPNPAWGWGRLDVAQLVLGAPAVANEAPTVTVAPAMAVLGTPVNLSAQGSFDDGDPLDILVFRWDVDYDGQWDREAKGLTSIEASFGEVGRTWVKVEVEDSQGATGAALLPVDVAEQLPVEPDDAASGQDGSGADSAAPGVDAEGEGGDGIGSTDSSGDTIAGDSAPHAEDVSMGDTLPDSQGTSPPPGLTSGSRGSDDGCVQNPRSSSHVPHATARALLFMCTLIYSVAVFSRRRAAPAGK